MEFLPKNLLEKKSQRLKDLQRYIVDPQKILSQIQDRFNLFAKKFDFLIKNNFAKKSEKLNSLQISNQLIFQKIDSEKRKIEFLFKRVKWSVDSNLTAKEISLKNLEKSLKANHYREILKRGFSLVKSKEGSLISSILEIKESEEIIVEMFDGSVEVRSQRNQGN